MGNRDNYGGLLLSQRYPSLTFSFHILPYEGYPFCIMSLSSTSTKINLCLEQNYHLPLRRYLFLIRRTCFHFYKNKSNSDYYLLCIISSDCEWLHTINVFSFRLTNEDLFKFTADATISLSYEILVAAESTQVHW